ncbi:hypothetical protein GTA08_BOTSDO09440 [Botryosphaeria dothidea]|uniref:Uncharacterized protein n=1 Tax=Botryosphaeria dothidea TaxID=55169 RepID=A0A8H4ILH3_9PEZI|nr:hypothetical protein GTA08_BOTSDO09440 [Botryosphaeria dothidea]
MSCFSSNIFATGLEQFGTLGSLNWDEEFDELVSDTPPSGDNADTNGNPTHMEEDIPIETESTSSSATSELYPINEQTVSSGPVIARSRPASTGFAEDDSTRPAIVCLPCRASTTPENHSPTIIHSPRLAPLASQTFEDQQDLYASLADEVPQDLAQMANAEPTYTTASHPGWSEETESWSFICSTSPQVSLWVASPGIFADIKWTLDASGKAQATDNHIPRVASCLARAIQHTYPVHNGVGVCWPIGSSGWKNRDRSEGRRMLYPRGAMGLKELWDRDVPHDTYVPNGIKVLAPTKYGSAFYPRPSRLSQMDVCEYDKPAEVKQALPISFFSGENYLEEEEGSEKAGDSLIAAEMKEAVDVEMAEDVEEVRVRAYEEDSDQEEGVELSFEEKIEAQFEMEIDGGNLPEHVVDEDDEHFYGSDGAANSLEATPMLTEDSDETDSEPSFGSFALWNEHVEFNVDTFIPLELSVTDQEALQEFMDDDLDHEVFHPVDEVKLPEIPFGYRWHKTVNATCNRGLHLIVEDDSGYGSDDSNFHFDNNKATRATATEDIDEAIARLEKMSMVSIEDLESSTAVDLSTSSVASANTSLTEVTGPVVVPAKEMVAHSGEQPHDSEILSGTTEVVDASNAPCIVHDPALTSISDAGPISRSKSAVVFDVLLGVGSIIHSIVSINPFSVFLW